MTFPDSQNAIPTNIGLSPYHTRIIEHIYTNDVTKYIFKLSIMDPLILLYNIIVSDNIYSTYNIIASEKLQLTVETTTISPAK